MPYGSGYGDSTLPKGDDLYSNEIRFESDVAMFGSSYNGLYVSSMYLAINRCHLQRNVLFVLYLNNVGEHKWYTDI